MSDRVNVIARTREAAHEAITHGYALAKALLADGKRVSVNIGEDEEDLTIKQRGFLHKAVFPQIADQVTFEDGSRFEWRVWKEMFRARFLGDRWVMRAVPRWDKAAGRWITPKKKTPHKERVSTEDLSIKQYSAYIDTVIDTAVLEYGVTFHFIDFEREEVRWKEPARKPRKEPAAAAA